MIILKSPEEIARMRAAGRVVYTALQAMRAAIKPGVTTTHDLECVAVDIITQAGADSAFFGYAPHGHPPFPAYTCISVNEQVVHGVPGRRVLLEGDIVGCDVGVKLNGYYADSAWTFPVGKVAPATQRLLEVAEAALYKGLEQLKPGKRLGDVGHAIEHHIRKYGYTVVRDMVGHGVGKSLHEEPQVPNYGKPGTGILLREGMTLAIEPMVNIGKREIESLNDEWTIVTSDRSLSAHFEHTVVVTRRGAEILTQGD